MSNPLAMASQPELIGDYRIVKELGRGAMGVVYLAVHPSLGRELALKVMAKDLAGDPDFLERFRREGEAAAKLRHPNIVQVFDFAHRDGMHFIAMEYLGATTLKDLLQEGGKQSVEDSCRMLDELLSALELAHSKGIVHRDIKPANVMVTDEGPVALTDFSIAHMKESSKLTQTGAIVGTPEYMAPEQFDGQWDGRSDLYAAAIVLYELLTGFSPFRAATITEVMRKQLLTVPDPPSMVDFLVPEAVSQVVSKALEKDPAARYQSAAEMRQALEDALRGASDKVVVDPAGAPAVPAAAEPSAAPADPPPVATVPSIEQASQLVRSEGDAAGAAAPPALRTPSRAWAPVVVTAPTKAPPDPATTTTDAGRAMGSKNSWQRATGLVMIAMAVVLGGGLWWGMEHDQRLPELATQASPTSAPVAVELPPPDRPLSPPVTPEPRHQPAPPAKPPQPRPPSLFPEKASIAPGVGVGDLGLGVGKQKVRAVWGEPAEGHSQAGMTRWAYGPLGRAATTAVYFNKKGVVEMIGVTTPDFTIAGSPHSRVGASYNAIKASFPNPSDSFPGGLNYRSQGVYFLFQDAKCNAILIYSPGRAVEKLEVF